MDEAETGIERAHGDYMGMLATVINGMAMQAALEREGLFTRLLSAIKMEQIAEPYIRRRAIEIQAYVILKGTRVDGIYTADPEKDSTATKYEKISFRECIDKNLRVMDMTAFTLCMENNLPIIVFDMNKKGNLARLLSGEKVGTLVSS